MCQVALETAAYMALFSVALAVLSPKVWHDVFLDWVRKKFGVGPGGSATEEGEVDE